MAPTMPPLPPPVRQGSARTGPIPDFYRIVWTGNQLHQAVGVSQALSRDWRNILTDLPPISCPFTAFMPFSTASRKVVEAASLTALFEISYLTEAH